MARGGRRVAVTPLVADTDALAACCKLQARREIDSVALIQGLENIIYYTVVDCTVWCSTFAVEQRLHQLFRLQDNKYGLL